MQSSHMLPQTHPKGSALWKRLTVSKKQKHPHRRHHCSNTETSVFNTLLLHPPNNCLSRKSFSSFSLMKSRVQDCRINMTKLKEEDVIRWPLKRALITLRISAREQHRSI